MRTVGSDCLGVLRQLIELNALLLDSCCESEDNLILIKKQKPIAASAREEFSSAASLGFRASQRDANF